jgi:hypothetical protein
MILIGLLATASAAQSVALMGEFLTHPGIVVGLEHPVSEHVVLAWNLGTYVHVRNTVGAFTDLELGVRHAFPSRFVLEGFAGVGYLHTFVQGPVYVVDDDAVEHVTDPGRPSFMPTVRFGVAAERETLTPFVHLQAFGQYPFNTQLLPHVALLVGVRS